MSAGSKNLLTSLAAFVPGMQVVANNERGSDPNTRPEILIRGRSSFEGSSNVPTFIVDGAEVNLVTCSIWISMMWRMLPC